MTQIQTALVLGATGNIGGEVARRLADRGWQVRALHRHPEALPHKDPRFQWIKGDAMVRDDVIQGARGSELIVHAVNPPGYRNWGALVLPMIESSLAAARASGARILLPGTVYNYSPDTFPPIDEGAPQRPLSRKGAIRAEMERRLEAASAEGVRTLIVRTGDYFGPGSGGSWFTGVMVKRSKPLHRLIYPGTPGTGHQWAYIPDVAETMIRLLEQDRLPTFATYHMAGHWDEDGRQMIESIRNAVGLDLKARAFPWWLLPVAAPFSELFRELREMRYLWQEAIRLDNRKLVSQLGQEPHTPLQQAVRETLRDLGVSTA